MVRYRKKGVALVTVVIIMGILMILGVALLNVSTAEAKNASWQKNRVQAHYLGRSGVYVGLQLIDSKLAINNYPDLGVLVSELNTQVAPLNTSGFNIGSDGKFSLSFESTEPGVVKIKSTGTTNGNPVATENVTYMVKINPGVALDVNPDAWVNGINLIKGITTSTTPSYLGMGVILEGKPIQSPQGSSDPSTFQTSIIYFRNYTQSGKSLSFQQIQNSVALTFDAEILYFESGVLLNKSLDSISFSLSNTVMDNRLSSIAYTGRVGFEDINRYQAFIGTLTVNRHSEYASKFFLGAKYGIVYFGGHVEREVNGNGPNERVLDAGYYYFKSGTNLHNPTLGEDATHKNFIRIPDDDAAIKAIKALFQQETSNEGYLWNRK